VVASFEGRMGLAGRFKSMMGLFVSRLGNVRDAALDAFKGVAIIGMIMVNHPPAEHIYAPFRHALWHGWTFADTIFPGFLLAVGISIVLALTGPSGQPLPATRAVHLRIVRRTLFLVVISFLLVNFPYFEFDKPQLAGTLSEIAFCYFIGALLYLHTRWRTQALVLVLVLLANWAWLTVVEVPGVGRGSLTPDAASARYLDQLLLGRYARGFETGENAPYGVLVHVSMLGSTLVGMLAGQWLRIFSRLAGQKRKGLFAGGGMLVVLGLAWDLLLPINKQLWTGSFVFFMGGLALMALAALYWLIEVARAGWLTVPLQIAGINALFFYVFAQCLQRVLVYGRLADATGSTVRLRHYIYQTYFAPWDAGKPGVLLYTLLFLLVCYAVVYFLYRRRIVVKL
jgi:predicted acyltransferase